VIIKTIDRKNSEKLIKFALFKKKSINLDKIKKIKSIRNKNCYKILLSHSFLKAGGDIFFLDPVLKD